MYLLDANVFIQSHRAHYGLDFVPAFWDWLDRSHATGALCSIDEIKVELDAGKDAVAAWALSRKPMFAQMDAACFPSLARLAEWARSANLRYSQAAVATFLASADYQLVAYAHAHGHTVVTHEVAAPESKKRIKIPDACHAMGVPWVDPFTMLRREHARFVLGADSGGNVGAA